MAPAPWTFPSHCSFLTGQWPFRNNSQWKYTLDASHPTLAEHLRSRGYQTAGFVANTQSCNYETGLDRGFAHYDDYPLTPRSLVGRSVAGEWLLRNLLSFGNDYDQKWIGLQSRGASEINDAFLAWLDRRRPDRPFFAFLNEFDAHAPYIAPPGRQGRFGMRPRTAGDYRVLLDFTTMDKNRITRRDVWLARDCYHDCIAFLDDQLGRLLDELQRRGLLENTDVIITSDHGEEFGEHLYFGHAYNTNLDAIGVPLVILSPARRRAGWCPAPSACATWPRPWSTCWASRPARPCRAAPWRPAGRRGPGRPRKRPAPPSPNRPRRPPSRPGHRPVASTRDSRCPWWPRVIITSGTAWGPSSSTT